MTFFGWSLGEILVGAAGIVGIICLILAMTTAKGREALAALGPRVADLLVTLLENALKPAKAAQLRRAQAKRSKVG